MGVPGTTNNQGMTGHGFMRTVLKGTLEKATTVLTPVVFSCANLSILIPTGGLWSVL